MTSHRRAKWLINTGCAHAADRASVQVSVSFFQERTTRFAGGAITHNDFAAGTVFEVTANVRGKLAMVRTDDLTGEGIRRAVDRAIEVAREQRAGEPAVAFPKPNGLAVVEKDIARYDGSIANLSAEEQTAKVEDIFLIGRQSRPRLKAAGDFRTIVRLEALGNSHGLLRVHEETQAACSCTMVGQLCTGWHQGVSWRLDEVDHVQIARSAAQHAVIGGKPEYLSPRTAIVILAPEAVAEMIAFLSLHLSAAGHYDETSVFAGKIGKQMLGSNITIRDDAKHPLQWGSHYDLSGLTRQPVVLVQDGVIKRPVVGRAYSDYFGWPATGHDSGPSRMDYESVANLVVGGGEKSLKELIEGTRSGFLVLGFGYLNAVDSTGLVATGDTRKGLYQIKNGTLHKRVKDFRFNVSIPWLLTRVVEMGVSTRAAGDEDSFPMVVPAMKVKGFPFQSLSQAPRRNRPQSR